MNNIDPQILYSLGYILIFGSVFTFVYNIVNKFVSKKTQLDYITLRILLPKKDSQGDKENSTEQNYQEAIGVMTQFYNNLHSLDAFDGGFLKAKKHISMEIVGEPSMIYFHVTCPFELESITEKFISSNYPGATVEPLYDYRYFHENTDQEYISLDLKKDDMYPITKLDDHKTDPINTILNSLSKLNENETAFLQILVRPKKHKWNEDMHKKVERMYENKTEGINYSLWDFISGNLAKSEEPEKNKELTPQQQENLKAIEEKLALPCFETNIRLVTSTPTTPRSKSVLRDLAGSFGHYNTVDQNKFELIQTSKISFLSRRIRKLNQALFRIWDSKEVSVLSGDELSQIFHFPDSRYNKSNLIKWQGYKTFPAPAGMPDEGVLLGYNTFRGRKSPVFMNNEDRFRHLYVIGQTGQGKSSIALTMARQDIEQGKGLCIMDPHGELADDILNYIPKERAEDVIYFNAGDEEFPIGLNLLEPKSDAEKDFLSNEFNAMFIKLYGADIWSPRLQEYGQMAALTLMDDEEEGGAITDLVALFTNEEFRNKKRAKVKNEIVRLWWDKTFDSMGDKEKQEIIPYFSAKFNSFVSNGLMRNIVGQAKGSFDFFDAMNDNKIILVNLAKGVIGEQNMSLLGMIFINKIQMATMRRATIPKKERTDFFFYIDEMQNFVSKSIGEILSEVRKYRLGMVMMHQYIAQLVKDGDSSVKDAVFGNVGSILSYKVGAEDAEHMKTEFAPLVSESDLTGLDAFNSVMRMSIDNQPTPPFSLNVQKYWEYDGTIEFDENRAELIKELSRYKYGRKAELVSGEIINRLKG